MFQLCTEIRKNRQISGGLFAFSRNVGTVELEQFPRIEEVDQGVVFNRRRELTTTRIRVKNEVDRVPRIAIKEGDQFVTSNFLALQKIRKQGGKLVAELELMQCLLLCCIALLIAEHILAPHASLYLAQHSPI